MSSTGEPGEIRFETRRHRGHLVTLYSITAEMLIVTTGDLDRFTGETMEIWFENWRELRTMDDHGNCLKPFLLCTNNYLRL